MKHVVGSITRCEEFQGSVIGDLSKVDGSIFRIRSENVSLPKTIFKIKLFFFRWQTALKWPIIHLRFWRLESSKMNRSLEFSKINRSLESARINRTLESARINRFLLFRISLRHIDLTEASVMFSQLYYQSKEVEFKFLICE